MGRRRHRAARLTAAHRYVHAAGEERTPELTIGERIQTRVDLFRDRFADRLVLERAQLI
jgi:hypothetical protein